MRGRDALAERMKQSLKQEKILEKLLHHNPQSRSIKGSYNTSVSISRRANNPDVINVAEAVKEVRLEKEREKEKAKQKACCSSGQKYGAVR